MIFDGDRLPRFRRQAGVDCQRGGIGSCSALARMGMAVPAGHKSRRADSH